MSQSSRVDAHAHCPVLQCYIRPPAKGVGFQLPALSLQLQELEEVVFSKPVLLQRNQLPWLPVGCFAVATPALVKMAANPRVQKFRLCLCAWRMRISQVHAKSSILQSWEEQVCSQYCVGTNDDLFRERMWLFSSQHFTRHALPPSLLIRVCATE